MQREALLLDAEQNHSLAELKERAARTNRQLEELVEANGRIFSNLSLSTRLWDDFNKGVCLITGTYVFIDPKSGRPWRLQSKQTGKSGGNSAQEEMPGGLKTEGDGEVVQVDYEGTGFHVGAGYILTNRHLVLDPWKNSSWVRIFDDIEKGTPRLTELRAFFPGQKRSYQIQFHLAASQEDLAVCTLNVKEIPRDIPNLPLDQNSASVAVGQAIVMIGYSGGIDRLLAFVPAPQVTNLLERYGDSGLPLLNQLARRDLTKPIASQGHMMDLNANHLIYDAAAGGGGSGSPLFGPSGRVIGIHSGYHQANRVTNSAVRIDPAKTLLERAGWRSPELSLTDAQ